MQSPLQQLLQAAVGRCDLDALHQLQRQPGGLEAVAELLEQEVEGEADLCEDVLAMALQAGVQGCVSDEQNVALTKQRATAAFSRQQYQQAAQLYTEALRYTDETASGTAGAELAARLYCNRALCLLRLAPPLPGAALADSSAAIACDPGFAKAYYRRACCKRQLGDLEGALADAQQALALEQQQQQQGSSGSGGSSGGGLQQARVLVEELQQAVDAAAGVETDAPPSAGAGAAAGGAATTEGQPAANGAAVDAALVASSEAAGTAAGVGALPNGTPATAAAAAAEPVPGATLLPPGLELQHTAGAGRSVAAACSLAAGADVLRERPYAQALTRLGRRSVCAYCCASLPEPPQPRYYCRRCPMPTYCSSTCRDADPFHTPGSPECGLPWTVLLPAEAVLALRLACKRAQQAAQQAEQASSPGTGSRGVPAAAVAVAEAGAVKQQVASLETHFPEMGAEHAAHAAALAALAAAVWRRAVSAAIAGAAALSLPTAAQVLHALCVLRVNGIAVVPPAAAGSEDRLALALYPRAALFNHSCQPNLSLRFEGCELVARTLRPAAPDQQLLLSYGPQAGEMDTTQRQRMLRQQYCFDCACTACASPLAAEAGLTGLRCTRPGCDGASGPPVATVASGLVSRYELTAVASRSGTDGGGSSSSSRCSRCDAQLSAEEWRSRVLPQLESAAGHYTEAVCLLDSAAQQQEQGDGEPQSQAQRQVAAQRAAARAVALLRQCLREQQALLHPANQLLGQTHDALARAWHAGGNAAAAADHLRHSLRVLARACPTSSSSSSTGSGNGSSTVTNGGSGGDTNTALAFQQLQLAAMLQLAAATAGAAEGSNAQAQLQEAEALAAAAAGVLQLHFGPELAGKLLRERGF